MLRKGRGVVGPALSILPTRVAARHSPKERERERETFLLHLIIIVALFISTTIRERMPPFRKFRRASARVPTHENKKQICTWKKGREITCGLRGKKIINRRYIYRRDRSRTFNNRESEKSKSIVEKKAR